MAKNMENDTNKILNLLRYGLDWMKAKSIVPRGLLG